MQEPGCSSRPSAGMRMCSITSARTWSRTSSDDQHAFSRRCSPRRRACAGCGSTTPRRSIPRPSAATGRIIFRLSATLTEPVDTDVLRTALDVTVRRFPSIAVRLRRGVFWYYLEQIPQAPEIAAGEELPARHTSPFDRGAQVRAAACWCITTGSPWSFSTRVTDGTGGHDLPQDAAWPSTSARNTACPSRRSRVYSGDSRSRTRRSSRTASCAMPGDVKASRTRGDGLAPQRHTGARRI